MPLRIDKRFIWLHIAINPDIERIILIVVGGNDIIFLGIFIQLIATNNTHPDQSTYAQIEKDLEQGLSLLKGAKYEVPHYHFTQQAAFAFATRFYLFKGNWDKAI